MKDKRTSERFIALHAFVQLTQPSKYICSVIQILFIFALESRHPQAPHQAKFRINDIRKAVRVHLKDENRLFRKSKKKMETFISCPKSGVRLVELVWLSESVGEDWMEFYACRT